jgi:hypothetical protein
MISMGEFVPALSVVYGIGVVVGVVVTDARPAVRVGLALAWPLGLLAFAVTVVMLLAAAPIAFVGRR